MRKLTIGMLAALVLFQTTAFAAGESRTNDDSVALSPDVLARVRQQYRDPFVAGLLSGLYWGLGQFYAREYTKGSLFMFGDLVYKGVLIGMLLKFKNKYTGSGDDSVRWREMTSGDRALAIGAVVTWLGMTIFSVADAAACANGYNRGNEPASRVDVSLDQNSGAPVVWLGWKMPF